MTATRGRRTTETCASPQAANMPISREPIMVPARNSASPRAMSDPAYDTNCPGEGARRISIARSPAGWVCSTMTMASAPRGSGPPVAIDVAVPDSTGRVGAVPQAIASSLSMTRTGVASLASARSTDRTAKPSTLERSNGGTSIGATTSSASAQPSASASARGSLGVARGNNAASKRASASSRDRMVRNWSWSTLSWFFGIGAFVISELISVPQHIGIDRRARSKTLSPARHGQPCIGAGDCLEREVADRERHPGPVIYFQQNDLGNADARGNLAYQRQRYRLPRRSPGQPVQHRQCQRPPCRQRLIRRARQHNDGYFSNPANSEGSARLQGDAMGENFAAPGQRPDRCVGAADAAAADGNKQIARTGTDRLCDRFGVSCCGLGVDNIGTGPARVLGNQLCRRRGA